MNCDGYRYSRPEIIPGLDFTPEEVEDARRQGKLLSADIELTGACNAACRYCYRYMAEGPQPPGPDELTAQQIVGFLRHSKTHHGLCRLCILGGEPLLQPVRTKYIAVMDACAELDVRHVTFTNGLCLDNKTTRMLRDYRAAVCIKLNGMSANVHDRLVGTPGAFEKAMRGFDRLFALGYGSDKGLQIAFETVITKDNYTDIEDMWIWARKRGVLPYVEKLTVQGRGAKHIDELHVSNAMIREKFELLNQIDRDIFGLDWNVTPPIAGGYHCVRFFMSIYIRADGLVRPCVGVDLNLGNVKQQSISEILTSPLMGITRQIDQHLKGKCRTCDLRKSCYGCRGAAYQAGDLFAEDPVCWRATASESPFHVLEAA